MVVKGKWHTRRNRLYMVCGVVQIECEIRCTVDLRDGGLARERESSNIIREEE